MSAAVPVSVSAVPAKGKQGGQSPGSFLYRGIKNMLRCDAAEVVQGIAHYVVTQHPILRLLSALTEATRGTPIPGFVALAGWLRAFLAVGSVPGKSGGVWIARLRNERRALGPFLSQSPDLQWNQVSFRRHPEGSTARALIRNLKPGRLLSLVRRMHRRYEFFKVLRVVEFIGYYQRYVELFQAGNYRVALMSNHSNPHGLAFNLAARKSGVPTVLVTHGMPVRPVARLNYELAVVHCAVAREIYRKEGCRHAHALIHGRKQDYSPMPTSLPEALTIGVFLCKDVNETVLRNLVSELLSQVEVKRLLIRPHPKNLWRGLEKWVASLNDPRIILSSRRAVIDDVRNSDLILAGNSSVLIDAVVAGRPAGFVSGLDYGPPDLHSFVARGLVYPVKQSYQGLIWDPASMVRFYQQREWPSRLRAFANIDQAHADVVDHAVTIMRRLAPQ